MLIGLNRLMIMGLLACPTVSVASTEALAYEEQSLQIGGISHIVRVPRGYRLELLTDRLDGPRFMTFTEKGDLLIGSRSGKLYRLAPPYTKPEVLVTLDDYPHSVALRDNEIFIGRTSGLYRAAYQPGQKSIADKSVSLVASLPEGSGHSSRTVAIGPDRRIYVSIGIQGNCSDQYIGENYEFDDRRGGILVLREQGEKPEWEAFGTGLRNPVGFAWHPQTGVMYTSNNGPDHWGFDQPPEYFSRVTAGSFHGMPWFQYDGQRLQRDDCISTTAPRPRTEVVTPVATFPARSAPMGVGFVPKGAMHKALEFDAIVAVHGSWATLPSGTALGSKASRRPPKLVAVRFQNGNAIRVDDLVTGFQMPDGKRWARPMGVAFGPDGALYFSSDSETNGLFRLKRK